MQIIEEWTGGQADALRQALMTKHEWNRDDANALSLSFDTALARGAVDEIERLSHMWLLSEAPQVIELGAGRRVSDDLVSTVERRVIQLRRADDYITGATSHDLMRNELAATVQLLSEAALSEEQARRLLVSVGEMAQLGAWVAADTGELGHAARYVRGGVMAAAGRDYALAGNIISTFSYQVANNGNPNDAAMLAQTAYAARQDLLQDQGDTRGGLSGCQDGALHAPAGGDGHHDVAPIGGHQRPQNRLPPRGGAGGRGGASGQQQTRGGHSRSDPGDGCRPGTRQPQAPNGFRHQFGPVTGPAG